MGCAGGASNPADACTPRAAINRRLFSCLDLSVDVLVKVLMGIPQVRTWKIEGRKKGPHYVYYVVTGYRLLRDHAGDPQAKKDALHFLSRALGRPGTHYYFLPQRPQNPLDTTEQTGSGLLVGRVKGAARQAFLTPQHELLSGDLLRVGYEDAPGHRVERVGRGVPKGGRYSLPASAVGIPKGTPVFLIDRREKALEDMLQGLATELPRLPDPFRPSAFRARLPTRARGRLSAGRAAGLSPTAAADRARPRWGFGWKAKSCPRWSPHRSFAACAGGSRRSCSRATRRRCGSGSTPCAAAGEELRAERPVAGRPVPPGGAAAAAVGRAVLQPRQPPGARDRGRARLQRGDRQPGARGRATC